MLQQVETSQVKLENYYPLMDEEAISDLERLANRLSGLRVAHLNATPIGGGVAEILRSLIPMMTGLGLPTGWYCITANAEFFQVTQNIHNSLQGVIGSSMGTLTRFS